MYTYTHYIYIYKYKHKYKYLLLLFLAIPAYLANPRRAKAQSSVQLVFQAKSTGTPPGRW